MPIGKEADCQEAKRGNPSTRLVWVRLITHLVEMSYPEEPNRQNQIKGHGLGEKWITIFGTWNVTSVTGKECEIAEEMRKYKIQTFGVGKTKKKRSGEQTLNQSYVFLYSGTDKKVQVKQKGVGIVMGEGYRQKGGRMGTS